MEFLKTPKTRVLMLNPKKQLHEHRERLPPTPNELG
jgi:hypothetical protein